MKTYILAYNIRDNYKDYSNFYASIKENYPEWRHICENAWLVKTNDCAGEIFRKIYGLMGDRDTLFVAEITGDCEGFIAKGTWDWLKDLEN